MWWLNNKKKEFWKVQGSVFWNKAIETGIQTPFSKPWKRNPGVRNEKEVDFILDENSSDDQYNRNGHDLHS